MGKIKRRYKVEKANHKNWAIITDCKEEKFWWMHVTDFGITHKHLPAYCAKNARALWS